MAAQFNLAAGLSRGEYLLPMGSDDLASDPDLLKEEVEILESLPEYDVVYCDHWLLRPDGKRVRIKYRGLGDLSREELYQRMLKKQEIAHGATLWRKEKMPRYDLSVAPADDWDLFLTALENGANFYHIPKRLWTYRVGHPHMSGTEAMAEGCKKVLAKRGINTCN